ncbi:DNA helicase [Stappia sp. BW2]|uniref:DNA helicase n=1 Tax=Stappia sp. BW2 TaxID=2592622 RepID=UPI0011DEADFC|nr:DNA helicase [Stappia sp. BW2]TYC66005.1 DNA helicase [Stappia sp. BW2]
MKLSAPVFRLKREARALARSKTIALNRALDAIAVREGFRSWSHLVSATRNQGPSIRLLSAFEPGDMVILGARPGHGKTVLGLELLAEAAKSGRSSVFFSSECSYRDVRTKLSDCGYADPGKIEKLSIVLSDSICAGTIQETLADPAPGTIAVIDYLQVMDQHRSQPPLGDQIEDMRQFAKKRRATLVFLSQVHRSFDPQSKSLPGFADIRTTNPVDLAHFDKGCFLHDGRMILSAH